MDWPRLGKLRRDAARFSRLGRLLWPHARGEKRLLSGGAGLSLGLLACQILQPWPLKWVFDLLGGDAAPFPSLDPRVSLALFSGAYVLIAIAGAVFEWGQLLVLNGLGNRVMAGFRRELYRHLLSQPLAWHDKKEVGELLTRIVSDTARLRRGVNGVLLKSVQTLALFAATSVVLLLLDARLAVIAGVTGIVALLAMAGTGRRILRASRKQREREGRLAGVVEESLSGVRDAQVYRTSGGDPRFDRQNAKSLREEQKVRRMEASLFLRINVLLSVSLCAVIWLGTRQVSNDAFTAGALVLFIHYLLALYRPFNVFAHQSARTGRVLACSDRLVKIVEKKPAIADGPGVAPPFRGAVAFDGVHVRARKRRSGGRRRVLENVGFRVEAGERVAIIGPNGAGKSSLLNAVCRLADPKRGSVVIDGKSLREWTLASVREQFSFVPQEPAFFGLSVRENLALGAAGKPFEAIEKAATLAQAIELIDRLPRKWDTKLARRGRLLSAGERQRLAIARALARDGRIWLLDEPTSALDSETAIAIEQVLREATHGKTTFWVTHDPALAMSFDRVLLLIKGRLRFDGTPAQMREWVTTSLPELRPPSLKRWFERLRAA